MPIQPAYLIYCIVEDEGIVSIAEDTTLQEIRYKDIAAIVREVEVERGEKPSKEQLQNWLIGHQQANIDIFQHRTLLPIRFGTMVGRKEDVQDFLAAGYLHIKMVLVKVRNKAEFVVQLFWDLKAVLNEIYRNEKDLLEGKDLVKSGRLLFQAVERKREEIVESVHRKLSAVSLDSSEAKRTDETMIMNWSYLIEKATEEVFDEVMAELGRKNHSYLRFKYVGPLPPCSFVPLEFRRGNFELINRARETLSLPDRARFREIKSAYRTLSLRYHPDKNSDKPGVEKLFKEIAEAYKILETYCLNCGMPPSAREDLEYSFERNDVGRVFIV